MSDDEPGAVAACGEDDVDDDGAEDKIFIDDEINHGVGRKHLTPGQDLSGWTSLY